MIHGAGGLHLITKSTENQQWAITSHRVLYDKAILAICEIDKDWLALCKNSDEIEFYNKKYDSFDPIKYKNPSGSRDMNSLKVIKDRLNKPYLLVRCSRWIQILDLKYL